MACRGDMGALMEGMKKMNLRGEGRDGRRPRLLWVEKGGEVWERMEEKARLVTGINNRKEGTNITFVNTRIVDSRI